MTVYTTAIQKGGTGKTTTATALAYTAAQSGKKTLAIDLDPQGSFSFSLKADTSGAGSYDLLNGTPAEELIQHIKKNLDVIPATWNLSTVKSEKGSALRLQKALDRISKWYDLCIIDTPATAGELQYNALQAADGIIIPLEANIYNLQSMYQIIDTAKQFQQSNKKLKLTGIIITRFDGRSTINRQMRETIIEKAEEMGVPCLGTVRKGVAVEEAAALQLPLMEYAPKSKPAEDYKEAFSALI